MQTRSALQCDFRALERPSDFIFSLAKSLHPGTISPERVMFNSQRSWNMPAVGVRRQNKSEHTKNFSRGYRCSDGVANPCLDWLDLLPVTLPGRARVPGCPLVQRSRCAGCGGTGSLLNGKKRCPWVPAAFSACGIRSLCGANDCNSGRQVSN